MEGVHIDFQRLAEWTTFETLSDYEDLISRYNVFDQYVQQGKNPFFCHYNGCCLHFTFTVIAMMRKAVKDGMTNNIASMQPVLNQIESHMGEPAGTIFYKPFAEMTGSVL